MDKKKQIVFNLNNFLLATSSALDAVSTNLLNTSENHNKRVAFIALKIASYMNLSVQEMSDLCSYCLVYNIGLKETKINSKDYCESSEEKVSRLPFLDKKVNILKYQCEFFNGSGLYSIKEEDIPLFSQLICFASYLDKKFSFENKSINNRNEIKEFVLNNENILFSSSLVDIFTQISSQSSFWLELQNENEILYFIFGNLHDFTITPSFEEVFEITSIFSNLIDKKSEEFFNRCKKMTEFYSFEHKDEQTFLIAASLYNIGKLFIKDETLDKNTRLTDIEYEEIKAYPFYTKKVLSNIMGFNDILSWAIKVQETIDGKGYPFSLVGKDLSLKDRLLRALVVYHALKSSKTYRESYSHEESIAIMFDMSENNKLDKAIIEDINKILIT